MRIEGLAKVLNIPISILILLVLTLSSGDATILKQTTLSSLVKDADFVVVGQIVEVRTTVEKDEPWTLVRVSVEKMIKGTATGSVVFRVPGGARLINGRTLIAMVEGVPSFSLLDRGVLFLKGSAPAYPGLLGWEQGYWRIELRNGVELASSNGSQEMPLPQFLRLLESYVKEK